MKRSKTSLAPKIILVVLILGIVGAGVFYAKPWQSNTSTISQESDSKATEAEILSPALQNVDVNSKLSMTFPTEIDQKEIEENLAIPEGLQGTQAWEKNTLTFTPDKPLTLGEKYTFNLNKQGVFASHRPIEYSFYVAGTPALTTHYPLAGGEDIDAKAAITLVFDRPMISLSTYQAEGSLDQFKDWPVTINPPVKGTWRWVGTTTAEFRPENQFRSATEYQVKVPAGLMTANNEKTAEETSFSFITTRPVISHTLPENNYKLANPSAEIAIYFNQEMNPEIAQSHLELLQIERKGKEVKSTPVPFSVKHFEGEDDEGKKIQNKQAIQLIPVNKLKRNTEYQIKAKEGLKAQEGQLGMKTDYTTTFKTVDEFAVKEVKQQEYGGLQILFTSPVEDETLPSNISIEPDVEGWKDMEFLTDPWTNHTELYLYPPLKPSTEYTLTFNTKIKDQFGEALKQNSEHKFTTPALDPQLEILTEEEFGLFEKEYTPLLPLKTVNLKQIQVEFGAMNLNDFIAVQNSKKADWRFKPDLSKFNNYEKFQLTPKNQLNQAELLNIDLNERIAKAGNFDFYGLRIKAPYKDRQGKNQTFDYDYYFALTNIGLTLKYSASKTLVWAIDLKTGAAVEGANITFYNNEGKEVMKAVTDKNGFAEQAFDVQQFKTTNNEGDPLFWVTAEKGADFTFVSSQWDNGLRAWNFGFGEDSPSTYRENYTLDAYVYTERNLYRAGDTVHFKGILRLRDKNGVISTVPNKYKARVTISDGENELLKKEYEINEYGSFNGELPLSSEARLGTYQLYVSLTPEVEIRNNYAGQPFYVLAYRKPEYQVEIRSQQENYFSEDKLEFKIKGSYFFGAPMTAAKVVWSAMTEDYWFNRYTEGWYAFSLEDNWCWWDCSYKKEMLTEGKGELDEEGEMTVRFPIDLENKPTSQSVHLEATIQDENNQSVTGSSVVPVHKAGVYVGVNTQDYAVAPGEKARINVITVDPSGKLMPNQKVELELMERRWNSIKKKSIDGAYYYENEPKDTPLKTINVTTGKDGKGVGEFILEKGGMYRVVATAKDGQGREAKSSTSFYIFSDTYINWPHQNNDRLDILADKPEYKVGETAKLLIKTPYQGKNVKALITVERENIMSKKVIDVTSNAQAFEVPITPDMLPNAFVSAIIIKPREGQTFDDNGQDTGAPAFKMGYVKLNVQTSQKELKIELKTDKQKYEPGETVKVSLKTVDHQGQPTPAEVSLSTVDLSVISLLGFRMPDLVEVFYQQRPLGVKTSQMLSHLIRTFKPGSKGGGGDGEDQARTNFKDTAFWKADITTNQEGLANVEFKLPDNLTTWQLLAIGHTKNHLYGAAVHEIIETKPVVLRAVMPRFAVKGDQIHAGAIVHNFTDKAQEFTVSLQGEGFEQEMKEQRITLKPQAQEKVIFPITVTADKQLTFNFKAESQNGTDALEQRLPVYLFGTPQAVATAGFTESEKNEGLYLPNSEGVKNGMVTLSVSPTVASHLTGGLEYLSTYPYGCAEQTVSSYLGNVVLSTLQNFKAFEWVEPKTLDKHVSTGLQKLYKFQRFDGGFGFWEGSDRSYPYLSAYILHSFYLTEKAGYTVDKNVVQKTSDYLKSVLREQNLKTLSLEKTQPELTADELNLAERAYILYVLAAVGQADLNLSNNLFEKRDALPLFAKAHLAMSYPADHENGKTLIKELLSQIKISSRGSHFEEKDEEKWRFAMNTNTNTTAIALQALLKFEPENEQIHKIVRYLLDVRRNGHWDTTQSTINSLMAFAEFLKSTQELNGNFKAKIEMNGQPIFGKQFNQENILTQETVKKLIDELQQGQLNTFEFIKEGEGRLYYDLTMNYFLAQNDIAAMDQGMGIKKELVEIGTKEGEEPKKPSQLVAGETYKIKLTMTVPQDQPFVVVDSPLPAGMEAIDFSFVTNQGSMQEEVKDNWNSAWHFNHIEFRDDRVVLFSDYLPAGVYEYEYLVRATTPGQFRYRPSHITDMYYPEIFGQTEGGWIEIE